MYRVSATLVLVLALTALPISAQQQVSPGSVQRTVPTAQFDGVALVDAIDFLRDLTGLNIHVNWKALESAGVGKDTVINLRMRDLKLRKILSLILNDAAGGSELLTFYVDGGVLEVTTQEEADKVMFTRVYPVQDLLVEVPDFAGPNINIEQNSGSGGSGSSGSILQNGSGNSDQEDAQLTRAERAQQLLDVITSTIRPDVWQVNGGTATIRFFNGNLIVTAPRSVHEMLGG